MRGFGCYHHAAVTVGTTATLLSAGAPRALKRGLVLKNNSSSVVYIGSEGVSTSNGMPLDPGEWLYLETDADISRQQSQ